DVLPPLQVGERSIALTSMLDILNDNLYDCQSLIDERLLGHFDLSPRVEPLGDSLENIMFSKLMRDHILGVRTGGTPPSQSLRRTPTSSESRGKCAASLTPGATLMGSSKRAKSNAIGSSPANSAKPPSGPPPPPSLKDEGGDPQ
ncbi:UNVERIFIED_CONTAM: hypothetical protein Sindi_2336600, partial [Sesamum indicum]